MAKTISKAKSTENRERNRSKRIKRNALRNKRKNVLKEKKKFSGNRVQFSAVPLHKRPVLCLINID